MVKKMGTNSVQLLVPVFNNVVKFHEEPSNKKQNNNKTNQTKQKTTRRSHKENTMN